MNNKGIGLVEIAVIIALLGLIVVMITSSMNL